MCATCDWTAASDALGNTKKKILTHARHNNARKALVARRRTETADDCRMLAHINQLNSFKVPRHAYSIFRWSYISLYLYMCIQCMYTGGALFNLRLLCVFLYLKDRCVIWLRWCIIGLLFIYYKPRAYSSYWRIIRSYAFYRANDDDRSYVILFRYVM